jgi:hypothetical protein
MAIDRFAAWLIETKDLAEEVDTPKGALFYYHAIKVIVYALLTIAVAINQAAEKKGK